MMEPVSKYIEVSNMPMVSCMMPTCNRRAFVPYAIRYFLQQDYENKELLIVDDGDDCIEDLIPAHNQIRYIRIEKNQTLGEKRNYCVQKSSGSLIMHWDDDDWMAPYRISYQVSELLKHQAEVCGLSEMFFCETVTGNCWLYTYPENARAWLAGGSLLYTRHFWEQRKFRDMQVASDTQFIFERTLTSFVQLSDKRFYVAAIHTNNTSRKNTSKYLWQVVSSDMIKKVMGDDWNHFVQSNEPALTDTQVAVTVKEKIAILITTCKRQVSLQKMVQQLTKEENQYELSIFIVDDEVLKNGKRNFWQTINILWQKVRHQTFDYYIQLPDDLELENNFISRSVAAWKAIDDPKKICLNLSLDEHRVGKTCWTNYWPTTHDWHQKRYLQTQWVDLLYIAEIAFFNQLQWTIMSVPASRWDANPELSSGVGQQISLRLHRQGWHLYQVSEKLSEHIGDSVMNPALRMRETMRTTSLPPIYAGMASIPEREYHLQQTIATILPYINHLFLFLNGYPRIPAWLSKYKKITPFLRRIENTDMGDSGKFYGLNKITDDDFYYFTMDDDMLYPPDYVWTMIRKIEAYQRKSVVGCGGYCMKLVVHHFYNDRSSNWHISTPNYEDRPVQILHTCLTAWHSSAISFHYEDCQKPNMGDLWLAIAAQKQRVPMLLIERPANWVKNQPLPLAQTIYGRYRTHCPDQTNVYNTWPHWTTLPLPQNTTAQQPIEQL